MAYTATKAVGGPVYIACASPAPNEHLRGTKDLIAAAGLPQPEVDFVKGIDDMEVALKSARVGVKDGRYKCVIVDDFGFFAAKTLDACVAANKAGYTAWDQYSRHVTNTVSRFLDLKCNVFVTMHFIETGAELDGQVPKSGPGIVPALQGATLRQTLMGAFPQVIWMEKAKNGERVFRLSVEGVTGPGCNNLPDDVKDIPADVGILLQALAGQPVESTDPTKRKR